MKQLLAVIVIVAMWTGFLGRSEPATTRPAKPRLERTPGPAQEERLFSLPTEGWEMGIMRLYHVGNEARLVMRFQRFCQDTPDETMRGKWSEQNSLVTITLDDGTELAFLRRGNGLWCGKCKLDRIPRTDLNPI